MLKIGNFKKSKKKPALWTLQSADPALDQGAPSLLQDLCPIALVTAQWVLGRGAWGSEQALGCSSSYQWAEEIKHGWAWERVRPGSRWEPRDCEQTAAWSREETAAAGVTDMCCMDFLRLRTKRQNVTDFTNILKILLTCRMIIFWLQWVKTIIKINTNYVLPFNMMMRKT